MKNRRNINRAHTIQYTPCRTTLHGRFLFCPPASDLPPFPPVSESVVLCALVVITRPPVDADLAVVLDLEVTSKPMLFFADFAVVATQYIYSRQAPRIQGLPFVQCFSCFYGLYSVYCTVVLVNCDMCTTVCTNCSLIKTQTCWSEK